MEAGHCRVQTQLFQQFTACCGVVAFTGSNVSGRRRRPHAGKLDLVFGAFVDEQSLVRTLHKNVHRAMQQPSGVHNAARQLFQNAVEFVNDVELFFAHQASTVLWAAPGSSTTYRGTP